MMGQKRGPSKAQTILAETRARMDEAKSVRDECEARLEMAQRMYELHVEVYGQIERSFARKPRSTNGTGKSSSAAPSATRKSSSKKEPKTVGAPSSPTDMGIALSTDANADVDIDNYMAR